MMKFIFAFLISISFVDGIFNENTNSVSNAAISGCGDAVQLTITLAGSMAFWGGIMRVAQKSGITDFIAKLFKPVARLLFSGLDLNGKAFKAITMNLTANLLGLGNAATPLGIEAVRRLKEEESTENAASDNIVMLVVLNTASIQLLPTTIAAMRLSHGSVSPLDILPAILISSLISVTAGVFMCKALGKTAQLSRYAGRMLKT